MQSKATTVDQYIAEAPQERQEALQKLRSTILTHLPKGFEEAMGYGMAGYAVPHSIYPAGYHCTPHLPLPFMGLLLKKIASIFTTWEFMQMKRFIIGF
jgi:hypothetical protein